MPGEVSGLKNAISKARGDASDNVPAGIRFLNEMSRRLTSVHTSILVVIAVLTLIALS